MQGWAGADFERAGYKKWGGNKAANAKTEVVQQEAQGTHKKKLTLRSCQPLGARDVSVGAHGCAPADTLLFECAPFCTPTKKNFTAERSIELPENMLEAAGQQVETRGLRPQKQRDNSRRPVDGILLRRHWKQP